jgi:hypothetical protein
MGVIWKFATKNFTIMVTDEDEQEFDLSWDDTGECRAKLDSGEWQMFAVKAAVFFRGNLLTYDYLGGNVYPDPKQFRDHVGLKGQYGSYFKDMVKSAIYEAREALTDIPYIRRKYVPSPADAMGTVYTIKCVNEPRGEGNGWYDCPEDKATGFEVRHLGELLMFFDTRIEAYKWCEERTHASMGQVL